MPIELVVWLNPDSSHVVHRQALAETRSGIAFLKLVVIAFRQRCATHLP